MRVGATFEGMFGVALALCALPLLSRRPAAMTRLWRVAIACWHRGERVGMRRSLHGKASKACQYLGLIYRDDGTWGPFGMSLPRLPGMRPFVPPANNVRPEKRA